jgi:hypothetical protein
MEQIADRAPTVRRPVLKHGHRGAAAKVHGRSRITNGKTLLPTASGCSTWARLMKDTLGSLVGHCGGIDLISETQKLAARRVSVLEAELVFLEDKIALTREHGDEPNPVDVQLYGQLADRQRRLSEPLGWDRTAREVSWRDQWLTDTQAESATPVEAESPTSDAATAAVVPSESDDGTAS